MPIVRMPISPTELFDLRRTPRTVAPLVNTMPGGPAVAWVDRASLDDDTRASTNSPTQQRSAKARAKKESV
jgi:hypothetical protein